MDLIADFAFPLPVTVIAEMLGVEAKDRLQFKVWSDKIVGGMGLRENRAVVQQAGDAILELAEYLRAVVKDRRRSPQEDLISDLVAAEEADGKLSEDEGRKIVDQRQWG